MASWKTYAQRWPGQALAAGLGMGWILAAGFRPRLLVGLFGARLIRETISRTTDFLACELKTFWNDAVPQRDGTDTEGANRA